MIKLNYSLQLDTRQLITWTENSKNCKPVVCLHWSLTRCRIDTNRCTYFWESLMIIMKLEIDAENTGKIYVPINNMGWRPLTVYHILCGRWRDVTLVNTSGLYVSCTRLNSLALGDVAVIDNLQIQLQIYISCEIVLGWMSQDLTDYWLLGWVGLWGFLWWAPSAKGKDHHGVSSGWSSVWHRSNTGLSSTQYEQIPIILGIWPFWLTPFFFRSITFWRAYG